MDYRFAVIGGGIVGLAVAARLAPHGSCIVLEQCDRLITRTSSHNSGVIHAGIYYPDRTLKTELCLAGAQRLYELADHGVTSRRVGKWIVATTPEEATVLEQLAERMTARGVKSRWVPAAEVAEGEPNLRACAVLESPNTGIIDVHSLAAYYEAQIEAAGESRPQDEQSVVVCRHQVVDADVRSDGSGVRLVTHSPSLTDDRRGVEVAEVRVAAVVNAAGHHSHRIAHKLGAAGRGVHLPPLHFWAGRYAVVAGRPMVRRLVYPVPLPGLQGLGTHATVDLAGAVSLGPDALYLGPAAGTGTTATASRVGDIVGAVDPDKIDEAVQDAARAAGGSGAVLDSMWANVTRYLPGLERDRLSPGQIGVRPKLSGPNDGFRDFYIEREYDEGERPRGSKCVVHCCGIESPGLTASPAIADRVAFLLGLQS